MLNMNAMIRNTSETWDPILFDKENLVEGFCGDWCTGLVLPLNQVGKGKLKCLSLKPLS